MTEAMPAFSEAVRSWFLSTFEKPTEIQERAWKSIAKGSDTLVIAPTGSGKTLAAFLFAIDRLVREKADAAQAAEKGERGTRILYVSPLKALGADVERNLARPLAAITNAALGRPADAFAADELVRVGMRTGDTPADERRRMLRKPPDILITTPESLYLMLTSKAAETLARVDTVIVDEIHAIAGTKRGSHLSLSLERLDALLGHATQRIGLSATVRPPEVVARFLGGTHPVEVVSTAQPPALDLSIRVPVDDLTAIPAFGGFGSDISSHTPDSRLGAPSIWPYLEAAILDEVLVHDSTIVFVNSRGLCERLTARLNDLYQRRCGIAVALPFETEGSIVRSDMGSSSEMIADAAEPIARAHHGSVAKDVRRAIEEDLKQGALKCVVATSSLELGIDMGDVDLVLQVAPPLSVSSGLQRVGRANHQVGGRSRGIVFPKVRTEIIDAAVIAEAMEEGAIERTTLVENALDVLAQQTVAAVAVSGEGLLADEWFETVRRSACFAELPRSAFDAVMEMLAGRLADGQVAAFAPRILADAETGMLKPVSMSQRLAVTSAGTIPDRGLYPVMLSAPTDHAGRKRVGELDEEMVHESRIGDIIILGTTTWKITDITNDRVLVQPAPGRSARLPFWHGEGVGHDRELGARRGRFLRVLADALGNADAEGSQAEGWPVGPSALRLSWPASEELDRIGLDARAKRNLAMLVAEQRIVTGAVPTDETLVLESCPDGSVGRYLIVHSPYGRRVHEPWALAISERIRERFGFDPQAAASDEGILLQVPADDGPAADPALVLFDPDGIVEAVTQAVSATALFAARFRECAARALLMTSTTPGKRTPLWQQRLRGAQILEEARAAGEFPILVEAARECLQDVYDLDGLAELMERLGAGSVRIVVAETEAPSPFAAPMAFGYVAEHLYEGDRPASESAAAALSVDSSLLGELLGTANVLDLIDAEVLHDVEAELQRRADGYRAFGTEGVASLLRELGPLDAAEVAERLTADADGNGEDESTGAFAGRACASEEEARSALAWLEREHRAFEARIGSASRWLSVDDALRFHAVLGIDVPAWAQSYLARTQASADPDRMLDGIIARFARTHAVVTAEEVVVRFGIEEAVARIALGRLVAQGRLRAFETSAPDGSTSMRWVDAGNLKRLRLRSLAKARAEIEPVGIDAYSRFLLRTQGVLPCEEEACVSVDRDRALDALAETIAQFEGVALPARAWEGSVFPARVPGYRAAFLDELLSEGEVVWVGGRDASSGARTVAFYPADSPFAPVALDVIDDAIEPMVEVPGGEAGGTCEGGEADEGHGLWRIVSQELAADPLMSFPALRACAEARLGSSIPESELATILLDALWAGRACVDSFAIVRSEGFDAKDLDTATSGAPSASKRVRSRRNRPRYGAAASAAKREARARVVSRRGARDALSGRWSIPVFAPEDPTLAAIEATESLLERYGVATSALALRAGAGFASIYPVLRGMEDAGSLLRGMFVEGLGPAQFADKHVIDDLRAMREQHDGIRIVRADDPASLYGTVLSWPVVEDAPVPKRVAGAYVVFDDGHLALYAAPNLKWLLCFLDDEERAAACMHALAKAVGRAVKDEGAAATKRRLVVESVNGQAVLTGPWADVLQRCGLIRDTRGMRLYVSPF